MKFSEYIQKTDENEAPKTIPMIIQSIRSFEMPTKKEYITILFTPAEGGFCGVADNLELNLFDRCCREEARIRAIHTLEALCTACGVDMDAFELDDSDPRRSLIHQLRQQLIGKIIMVSLSFTGEEMR